MNDKNKMICLATGVAFNLALIFCKNEKIGKIIAATGIVTVVAEITYCVIEELRDIKEENQYDE